jgi:hypothetical protein
MIHSFLMTLQNDPWPLRNAGTEVVHDWWQLSDPENPHRLEASAKKLLRLVLIHHPTEKLTGLAAEIAAHTYELQDIASRIFTAQHSSPNIL